MQSAPLRLGLTGGIGSGKTTVARVLAACGAAVVDADAVSRSLTLPGGSAMAGIAAEFGSDAVAGDGGMDRAFMRQLVFADRSARQRLEAIIHPLVGARIETLSIEAAQAGAACLVFDIPLLVESHRWRPMLDQVLVVDCLESTQVARVMARSQWSRASVDAAIASQASRAQRLSAADVSLYNEDLTLEMLDHAVRQLAARFGL